MDEFNGMKMKKGMSSEDQLNNLFCILRSEESTVKEEVVQAWIGTVSAGGSSFSFSLTAKLKAFFTTTLGKVLTALLLGMLGISILGIFAAESSPETRVTSAPQRMSDMVKDSTIELRKSPSENNSELSKNNVVKSPRIEQEQPRISPFTFQFLPLHLQDLQREDSTQDIVQIPKTARQWAGVYKTYEDYLAKRFFDSIPLNVDKNKIYVGSFDRIVLKTDERKTSYKLGSLYGFFDGKNLRRYRLTNSQWEAYGYFTVRETNGLILYSQVQSGYKGTQQTNFYYSLELNSPIRSLTVKQLSSEFSNPNFIDEVKKKVDRLINMSQEKWSVALMEINTIYRKYY